MTTGAGIPVPSRASMLTRLPISAAGTLRKPANVRTISRIFVAARRANAHRVPEPRANISMPVPRAARVPGVDLDRSVPGSGVWSWASPRIPVCENSHQLKHGVDQLVLQYYAGWCVYYGG